MCQICAALQPTSRDVSHQARISNSDVRAGQEIIVDDLVDYIVSGFWGAFEDGRRRAFSLDDSRSITYNFSSLGTKEQALAAAAMEAWSTAAGINFVPSPTRDAAQILFDNSQDGAFTETDWQGVHIRTSTININASFLKGPMSLNSYWFQTYMHELGHALGLGHPGLYNGSGDFASSAQFKLDSWQVTLMSYFPQNENPNIVASQATTVTPMLADVQAIRFLYGTDVDVNAGNTVYGSDSNVGGYLGTFFGAAFDGKPVAREVFNNKSFAFTILDTGGVDTINLTRMTQDQRINLNDQTASDVGGLLGNMVIARDTIIENFLGGLGADDVTGNEASNQISGNAGSDSLFGGGGRDVLNGGAGSDIMAGGPGRDIFVFSDGRDVIRDFHDNADTLRLSDDLWNGRDLTIRKVLKFAQRQGDDLVFQFRGGHQIVLEDQRNKMILLNDLVII